MSLEGYTAVKKVAANMQRLVDWFESNRPSVDRITLSKPDWAVIMKNQESGVAFGIRYTDPPTFRGYDLHCQGDST